MNEFLNLPLKASEHAIRIDNKIYMIHYLMFALFLGWTIYFLYTLYKFRAKANPKASYVGAKSHISTYLAIAVALFEGYFLITSSIPLWSQRVDDFPKENEATVVRIIAQQFQWNIHYPGLDGKFGKVDRTLITAENAIGIDRNDQDAKDDIVMINQLNLPVNKPVIIHLSSLDVIHSLGLPVMRVKQDAIPGQEIPVWFLPTVKNDESNPNYEIACAQLCGNSHYRMRGFMTIQSQEEFENFIKTETEYLTTSY